MAELRPAALAFNTIAPVFDCRFDEWQSVAAQRRAVRRVLTRAFPPSGQLLELGGGTGIDAAWLAQRGFRLISTDASPAMVAQAQAKLAPLGSSAEVVAAEELEQFADRHFQGGGALFDGAFSNFAPLNCVEDLNPIAVGLARLLRPGAAAMLVLFGVASPGEMLVETLRGRPSQAFRRLRRGGVPARLAGQNFVVTYHRSRALAHALQPWFRLSKRHGIGIFVPPSAAEPWISHHPRLLSLLEVLDSASERPLALLGDHILYHFDRTEQAAP